MHVEQAQELATGRGVKIAVIDSGMVGVEGLDIAGVTAIAGVNPNTRLSGHGTIVAGRGRADGEHARIVGGEDVGVVVGRAREAGVGGADRDVARGCHHDDPEVDEARDRRLELRVALADGERDVDDVDLLLRLRPDHGLDAGGDAGRGQHVALVDVQHFRIHLHLRMAARQLRSRGPVRGGRASVQQAGFQHRKGAQAQRHHAGAARVRLTQRLQQRRRGGAAVVVPGRHDDDVGALQAIESVAGTNAEAGAGLQHGGTEAAHAQFEFLPSAQAAAEHQAGHR
jgi:hypothetical protein